MIPTQGSLEQAASTLWSWLESGGWQTALVATAALLLCRVFSRAPAAVRHSILLLALLKFALPPWVLPNAGACCICE